MLVQESKQADGSPQTWWCHVVDTERLHICNFDFEQEPSLHLIQSVELGRFFVYVTKIRLMKFPVCRQGLTRRTPKRTSGQLAVRQLRLTTETALSTVAHFFCLRQDKKSPLGKSWGSTRPKPKEPEGTLNPSRCAPGKFQV